MKNRRTILLCSALAVLYASSPHRANASDRPNVALTFVGDMDWKDAGGCGDDFVEMTASAAVAKPRKNIVLILADDLGWADTTLYGKTSLYETPNIQRLAARGMTFTNAYAASPICSPTRASIMTGQNPARHGMTSPAAHLAEVRFDAIASENGPPHQKSTNVRSATRLDPSLPTLGMMLKSAGYATAHFGKWHLGLEPHSPLELGFDVDIPSFCRIRSGAEIDWIEIGPEKGNARDRQRWDFDGPADSSK